jgi:hypothetical protein
VGKAVCQEASDENKSELFQVLPEFMAFASFQEVDAVPIARS